MTAKCTLCGALIDNPWPMLRPVCMRCWARRNDDLVRRQTKDDR